MQTEDRQDSDDVQPGLRPENRLGAFRQVNIPPVRIGKNGLKTRR